MKRNKFGRGEKREMEQRTKRGEHVSESERADWKEKEKKKEFLRFGVNCTRQEKKKGNREEGRISVSSLTSGKIRTY